MTESLDVRTCFAQASNDWLSARIALLQRPGDSKAMARPDESGCRFGGLLPRLAFRTWVRPQRGALVRGTSNDKPIGRVALLLFDYTFGNQPVQPVPRLHLIEIQLVGDLSGLLGYVK